MLPEEEPGRQRRRRTRTAADIGDGAQTVEITEPSVGVLKDQTNSIATSTTTSPLVVSLTPSKTNTPIITTSVLTASPQSPQDLDSESPQYRRRQYRRPDTFESPDAASSTANSSSATAGGTKPTLRRRTTANNNIGNNKENIGPDGEPLIDFERLAEEIKQQSELPVQMAKRESIIAVASDECKIYFYPDDLVNKSSTEEEKMKRNLEEEGFYVERNPNVYWFNLRRMEERLKRTVPPGRFGRWFGPDNKMLSSVDKTISAPQRPIYAVREAAENPQSVESPDERLETEPWKPRAFPYINEEDHAFFEREGNTPNNYRLVFSLHELEFADHPLMIEETRVSKRLKALVDTYNSRTKNNITAYWEAKLNALQLAYRDFKIKYPDAETYQQARMQKLRQTAAMAHSRPSSNASSFSVKTIDRRRSNRKDSDSSGDEIDEDRELIYLEKRREYLKQIQKLHDRYENESLNDRTIEWKILKCWETLKTARKNQSFSSTKSRIVVRRQETDADQDVIQRERYVAGYLNELQELFDIEREIADEAKMPEQNDDAENISRPIFPAPSDPFLENNEPPESHQNFTARRRRNKSNATTVDAPNFDREMTKQWIQKASDSSFRPPGTPILKILLTDLEEITPFTSTPKPEQLRRSFIEQINISLRLLINGREVLKTNGRPLTMENFTVDFVDEYEDFIVQTVDPPKSILVEVYEKSALGSRQITDMSLQLPNKHEQIRTIDQEVVQSEFLGIQFIVVREYESYRNPLWLTKNPESSTCAGFFRFVAVWDVDQNGNVLAPRSISKKTNQKESEKLVAAITDPNDPRFVPEKDSAKDQQSRSNAGLGASPKTKTDRLGDELAIGDPSRISKRNELLMLRNQSKIDIKKPIPQEEEQILDSYFDMTADVEYKASQMLHSPQSAFRSSMANLARVGGTIPATTAIATTPFAIDNSIHDFLKRIRTHQLYKSFLSQQLHRSLTFDDYVREEKPPEKTETSFLEDLFRQRRRLRPERKSRSTRAIPNPNKCNIIVHVARGINIPVRFGDAAAQRKSDETVNSFVEVAFQQNKQRTSSQEGSNPQWNESVTLKFEPPNNDYRPENLQNVRDNIYLNIFDEVTIDMIKDEREREKQIHQRKERKWLGTLVIPFSALYQNVVVEGKFYVKTPILNFGYIAPSHSAQSGEKLQVVSNDPILELYLTLEPALMQPPSLAPKFDSDEEVELLRLASRWKHSLQNNGKQITATAIGLSGKTNFITRYINPMAPPVGIDTEEKIMRFVSTVPYFQDRTALATTLDLWSTANEMLDIGAGDEAEHAILLCNYFLHLKKRAFVALGRANPEGKAAYVLVETDMKVVVNNPESLDLWTWFWPQSITRRVCYLYSPLTGAKYDSSDPLCPMNEVHCVFNNHNIWANIQPAKQVSKLNFDLENKNCWKPLFSPKVSIDISRTIQRESLTYEVPTKENLREMERMISQVLSGKIEKWRGRFVTRWNRSCSRVFENLLPKFEIHRQGVAKTSMEEQLSEVEKIRAMYNIRGFPINCSFTDVDSIVEAVHNTEVYESVDPTAEFALATYCHGYVNGVVSVWIYVACLTRTIPGFSNMPKTATLGRKQY